MLDLKKKYKTAKTCDPVRLISDNGPFEYPFVGIVGTGEPEIVSCWNAAGAPRFFTGQSLVEIKETKTYWSNFYVYDGHPYNTTLYATEEEALSKAQRDEGYIGTQVVKVVL